MRISDWSSDVCSSDLHCAGALGFIDLRIQRVAYLQRTFKQLAVMTEHAALDFLRIGNLEADTLPLQQAGVARLPTGFGIERRCIEHHDSLQIGRAHV